MKNLVLAILVTVSSLAFAGQRDQSGVECNVKAANVVSQYFQVARTYEKLGFAIADTDKVKTLSFENTTPGTYDQEFIATFVIKMDRSQSAYRPSRDQKVKVKFTGDFDCDNLKVKDLKALGGVERVD